MLLTSAVKLKNDDPHPKMARTLLIDRGACYMFLMATALVLTVFEVPSINTSVKLDSHPFTLESNNSYHESTMDPILQLDSIRNNDHLHTKNVTCFITGIAGFIGMSLAKQLTNSSIFPNTRVIGLDSFNTYYIPRLKRERAQHLIRSGVDVIWGGM